MKRWHGSLLLAVLFLCSPVSFVKAQSLAELEVTATFDHQHLPAILEKLESDYQLLFYFRQEELPEKKYSLSFEKEPLEKVLQSLLQDTPLGYLFYRDYAVVIAPAQILDEAYTANYYRILQESIVAETDTSSVQQWVVVGQAGQLSPSGKATITGQVRDGQSGEPVIGASLFFRELHTGTASDENGNFALEAPIGKHELSVQYVGYQELIQALQVFSSGRVDLKLQKMAINLDEVIVEAQAPDAKVKDVQVGVTRLDIKAIRKLPAFLGEADVIKSLLLQPGVSSIGEGATGINVRGGEVDQNLFLLDEGFVFNASHALGFFSTFQSDLIREATLYKGNIPAQYGGRLASVLEVKMRDGNFKKFQSKGGLGPVSSRISLEGPVFKEKSSFIAGLRSTYSDWALGLVNVPEVKRSSAFFYDANFRYTHRLNKKNALILSAYLSHDDFEYNRQFGFDYTTQMAQLDYKKTFSDHLFSSTSFTASQYKNIQSNLEGTDASKLENSLSYVKFREHLTFTPVKSLNMDAGFSSILYLQEPGSVSPGGGNSTAVEKTLEKEKGLESSIFLNAEWAASPALTISGGLRFALYQYLGAKTVFNYAQSLNPEQITDTTFFGPGQVIATYASAEPRFSLRYRFNRQTSLKAGYARTSQFINQVSNSDVPTPTSLWLLSSLYVEPQRSHNFSIGFFRNFSNNNWETSVETYFRLIDHLFDYRDFATLTVNEHIETELLSGEGRAYGIELSIRKKQGPINGWLSYTLSRAERHVQGINRGDWYPSNYDKPHDLSLVLNFQANRRNTFALNFNYSTGRPATPPVGRYQAGNGLNIPVYSERNQLRIPDYHRLDFAYTLGQSHDRAKRFKTSWTFSLYNVYGRRNAFSVFFTQKPFQRPVANRLAVLGSVFPAITFNFEII